MSEGTVNAPNVLDPNIGLCKKNRDRYFRTGLLFSKLSIKVSAVNFQQHLDCVVCVYTVSQKKQDTKLLPITFPNVNRFS